MTPDTRKRSTWFPISTFPVLPGWYEVADVRGHSLGRIHWSKKRGWRDGDYALLIEEGDQWRGLAEKP